jgi:rhodanese-related sulfurtransferase
VLTGDTLFIGDVGRPDLLASAGVTADELARQLYTSLHDRLLDLPDGTRVFPAHGAGSACGKHLSTDTTSTIGEQRRTNYALAPMSVDQFVAAVTEGQSAVPDYFAHDASLNRKGHPLFDAGQPAALDLDAVLAAQVAGAVVVDTRDAAAFAAGHLRGSINVGLEGRFAEYAGAVLSPDTDLVLLTDPGGEARTRLARIGFDRVTGIVAGGPAALIERPDVVERSSRLTAEQLDDRLATVPGLQVVDVRGPGERTRGMAPGARAIPLPSLRARLGELDLHRPIAVYCAGGYRSSIAASVLRAAGADDVSDLLGGYGAWAAGTRAAVAPGADR